VGEEEPAPNRTPGRAARHGGAHLPVQVDPRTPVGTAWLGAAALVAGFSLLLVIAPDAYAQLNAEDSWTENATVLLAVAAGLMLLRAAFGKSGTASRLHCAAFGVAGVALLLVAGEEISWGQRIFGLETPEEWKTVNEQGEINLHNVNVRVFNNLWQAAVYVLVVVTLVMDAAGRRQLFGFALPARPTVYAFVFVLAYRTHTTWLDGSWHDLADWLCWALVVGSGALALRRGERAVAGMAFATFAAMPVVTYLNHQASHATAMNMVSEAQEFLFLFVCLAYAIQLTGFGATATSESGASAPAA